MTKTRTIALAAFLLLAGAVFLRLCRTPPLPGTVPRPALDIPPVRDRPSPPPPLLRTQAPPPERPSPERLRPFLEKLGRARILRDRRTLASLRAQVPPVFESDLPELSSWLGEDLFLAAGVTELVRLFGLHDAVPSLAASLALPGHPLLKDVIIESLASLGGDAAEVALLQALQRDADDTIRLRSAGALSVFRTPEVYGALIQALHDPSSRVRSAAGAALARLNIAGTVEALLRALGEERDPGVQAELVVSTFAAGGEASRETLLRLLELRPGAAEILRSRTRARDDARYQRSYPRSFFDPGGPSIPFDAAKQRIGITLEPGSMIEPREVASQLFGAAPLDRYRDWFYIRKADDFPDLKAYDGFGNAMEPVPYGDLEGKVFLHFKDPASFAKGVLGYTTGCHAFVQGASLLHEFGHAFAGLGDEYADGSQESAANLFRQPAVPWMPLVSSSLLPVPLRRDADFFMPSDNCYLNNNLAQNRYCPVCQLEIHARIAELTGAPLPW
ncbi:MAG TPA: HEAT repeat domain-containing protein [Planctomycetota bacterium]|nr:HEAT repeat domain-containing protein [Planctomycetota bacterium]